MKCKHFFDAKYISTPRSTKYILIYYSHVHLLSRQSLQFVTHLHTHTENRIECIYTFKSPFAGRWIHYIHLPSCSQSISNSSHRIHLCDDKPRSHIMQIFRPASTAATKRSIRIFSWGLMESRCPQRPMINAGNPATYINNCTGDAHSHIAVCW